MRRPFPVRRRGVLAPLVLCAGLAVGASACGDPDAGTNGVGRLPAAQIEQRARAAVDRAHAVHLTGALVDGGQTYRLDMRLGDDGGTGSVTSGTSTFGLLRVKDALYLRADAGFWNRASAGAEPPPAGAEVGDRLGGKYVKVPVDDPAYRQLRGFTDLHALLGGLIVLGGTPSKGDRGTAGGVRTVELEGPGDGLLDISLSGAPYPLRLVRAGGGGKLTLTDWDRPVPLAAPPQDQTVDYGATLPRT
jgi:hypothetical protein